MQKLLATAAFAAALIAPVAAQAQAVPPAVVAVVDLERVQSECAACKVAGSALRAQATAQEAREKALVAPLQTEQQSIQTAINALNGKEPDAALQARAKAFETKYQQAQQQAASGREQIQRNQQYIAKQIQDKLNPIYSQVMQKRGANILVEVGNTLATSSNIDVTADVLSALNAVLPTVNTTAPPAPKPSQPQGR